MLGRSWYRLLAILCVLALPAWAQEIPTIRGVLDSPPPAGRMTDTVAPRLPVIPPIGPSRPIVPVASPFPTMVRAAGMIFSGTVVRIERGGTHSAWNGEHGHGDSWSRDGMARGDELETVGITFHVEGAIRGVTPGDLITIRQWIGMWSAGQRYRVGERVLLFLYPPSKLGLTSWVGGRMGRFDVDAGGRVWLTAMHMAALRTDSALGGKSQFRFSDFALAVRRAAGEE